jgi:hypothetical protein
MRLGAGAATAVAGVAALACVAGVAVLAWPGAEKGVGQTASSDVLPLAVPLEQRSVERSRALVMSTGGSGSVEFAVLATDGSEYVSGRAFVDAAGVPLARPGGTAMGIDVLAESVAHLAAGGEGDTAALGAWGIGMVVAAPGEDRIKAALDANTSLTLVGGSDRGTSYRVDRSLSDARVSRAWVESTEGVIVVPSTYGSGRLELPSDAGGLLVIAVPRDSAWSAWLDGVQLYETADQWGRQAFAVPSDGGTLEYSYRDGAHRAWWWAAAGATAWALLGAIPLGARGLRERES